MKNNSNNLKILGKKTTKYIYFFVFCVFPFIWAVYEFGPDVVFYFDQIQGEAKIISVNKNQIKFNYFHENLSEQINLISKIDDLKKIKKLKGKTNWSIIYSKTYPERVSLTGIDPKPGLLSSIYILIWVIPLLFFKKLNID